MPARPSLLPLASMVLLMGHLAAQATLAVGVGAGPSSSISPQPVVLPATLHLEIQAPNLPGASALLLVSLGPTGSNPSFQIAPGLLLNVAPGFTIFDLFLLSPTGTHTSFLPVLSPVPAAVGVLSAFWQGAVVAPSQPAGVLLTNPMETPVSAGPPVWSQLTTAGPLPPGRSSAGFLFDPLGQRLIISHGSTGFGGNVLQDTWALSLGGPTPTWNHLLAGGSVPAARWGNTLVRDSVANRLLLFGGSVQGFLPGNDVHSLSLAPGAAPVWSTLSPAGTPPPGRRSHSAIFDAAHNRMLVYGGGAGFFPGGTTLGDLWALDFSSSPQGVWTPLTPAGPLPPARELHSAILDVANQRMVVFGGVAQGGMDLGDLWALSLQPGAMAWTQLAPGGPTPAPRQSHTAIYDAGNRRMVLFGGISGGADVVGLAALRLAPGLEQWSLPTATGPIPAARDSHAAVYDSVARRMLVQGGFTMFPSTPFQDTWALDLP